MATLAYPESSDEDLFDREKPRSRHRKKKASQSAHDDQKYNSDASARYEEYDEVYSQHRDREDSRASHDYMKFIPEGSARYEERTPNASDSRKRQPRIRQSRLPRAESNGPRDQYVEDARYSEADFRKRSSVRRESIEGYAGSGPELQYSEQFAPQRSRSRPGEIDGTRIPSGNRQRRRERETLRTGPDRYQNRRASDASARSVSRVRRYKIHEDIDSQRRPADSNGRFDHSEVRSDALSDASTGHRASSAASNPSSIRHKPTTRREEGREDVRTSVSRAIKGFQNNNDKDPRRLMEMKYDVVLDTLPLTIKDIEEDFELRMEGRSASEGLASQDIASGLLDMSDDGLSDKDAKEILDAVINDMDLRRLAMPYVSRDEQWQNRRQRTEARDEAEFSRKLREREALAREREKELEERERELRRQEAILRTHMPRFVVDEPQDPTRSRSGSRWRADP